MTNKNNYGIYIHIPYCKKKCDYCNFISYEDFSTQRAYVKKLKQEIEARASGETCDTIFIGGGTPSVLYRGGLTEIKNCIFDCFNISDNLEFTIEVNPESCSDEFLFECLNIGINRLSLGVQSCNNKILKGAGRLHNYEDFFSAFQKARIYGIKNISVDLIIGLAGESEQTFCQSLKMLINLSPEHISLYSLICEQGTKLHENGYKPNDDMMRDLYDIAVSTLEKNGYHRYEVSNFSKSGFESCHNTKYWTLAPYFGFGIAAHSFIGNIRRANTSNLAQYLDGEILDNECNVSSDEREEFIMLGLRMNSGISLVEYKERFFEDLLTIHKQSINELKSGGYIIIEDNRLKINPKYMYIMNSIISLLI